MTLHDLQAESDIRRVIYRYCRGVDRRDFDLLRSCYHPDASDDHGVYRGGVDGLLAYIRAESEKFEFTMHFTGNVLIEVDGDAARAESYTVAIHRLAGRGTKLPRNLVVGLRYVDRFECRAGSWAIAHRSCVYAWSQIADVDIPGFDFGSVYAMSTHWPEDPVYRRASSIEPPTS